MPKIKVKQKNLNFRKPFYEMGDKVTALSNEAYANQDFAILKKLNEIAKIQDEIKDLLDQRYIWD